MVTVWWQTFNRLEIILSIGPLMAATGDGEGKFLPGLLPERIVPDKASSFRNNVPQQKPVGSQVSLSGWEEKPSKSSSSAIPSSWKFPTDKLWQCSSQFSGFSYSCSQVPCPPYVLHSQLPVTCEWFFQMADKPWMLGSRTSSDLAKLINSYVMLLCCCLGQLGFGRGAITSVPGKTQPKVTECAQSQLDSPCLGFPVLGAAGMQEERYTNPPARR